MIVTARAAESESEKGRAGGRHAIDDGLDAVLLEVDPALEIAGSVAVESGGDQLIDSRVRQQVAGELLDRELIEGHIAIEGVDDPVAILPHLAGSVNGVAVGIGVAGDVEPVASP